MPTYVYECPEHGQFEVVKPMADSGREEWCHWTDWQVCGLPATKVITSPAGLIMNPSGDGYFFNKASGLRSSGKGKR